MRRARKWERDLLKSPTGPRSVAAEEYVAKVLLAETPPRGWQHTATSLGLSPEALRRWMTDEPLRGWEEIANWLGADERNLRKAWASSSLLRRTIRKVGGRYVADPGELLNVIPELYDRRGGGEGRSMAARVAPREGGRFVSRKARQDLKIEGAHREVRTLRRSSHK